MGEGVVGRIADYARQQAAFIKTHPDVCLALSYKKMIKDPLACVKEIYEHAGKDFSAEVESAMKDHMQSNKKGKHGKAVYSLDKFSLSEEMIDKEFAGYDKFL